MSRGSRRMVLAACFLSSAALAGCLQGGGRATGGEEGVIEAPSLAGWAGKEGIDARWIGVLGAPATSGQDKWPGTFDARVTPVDVDGDGLDELVVPSRDRHVYVFDPASGDIRAKLPIRLPPSWHVENILNPVAAGHIMPDGPMVLVATSPAAYVTAWAFSGLDEHGDFAFERLWEVRTDACYSGAGMDAGATLADLDQDGELEVLVQTEQVGFYALESDGSALWSQCWAGGNAEAVAEDLDGDGDLEAIFASDSGLLSVLDGATGSPQWSFNAADPRYGISPASISVAPTVADLDGALPLEVLFTARHAPVDDPIAFQSFHMAIFAVRENPETWRSELIWRVQPEWANPMSYTPLIVEDVDQDGAMDILGMDWNTIGHWPGNWEHLGPANAFRLDAQGQTVWVQSIDAWWSNKAIALADSDDDGTLEVLVNGAGLGGDGIWRLDAATGTKEGFLSAGGWKLMRGPQLLDLRHDGQLDLVFPVGPIEGPPHGAVLVFDLDVPATRLGDVP